MPFNVVSARPAAKSKVWVRDTTHSNELYHSYIKIPGVSGFNLPDNDRTAQVVRQLDGAAQIGGTLEPGQATVTLAALHRSNPAMQLLYDNQESAKLLDFRFESPAIAQGAVEAAYTVLDAKKNELVIPDAKQADVTLIAREGMVFKVGAVVYSIIGFTANAADDDKIAKIQVFPAFGAAVGAAAKLELFIPKETNDIRCTVQGISKGNAQEGQAVSGEIRLAPDQVVGSPTFDTA